MSLANHSDSYVALALSDPSKLTVDQLIEAVAYLQANVSEEVADLKADVADLEDALTEQERATTTVREYADAARLSVVKLEGELETLTETLDSIGT